MDRQCGRQLYDRTCCAKQMWERLRRPMNTKHARKTPHRLRAAGMRPHPRGAPRRGVAMTPGSPAPLEPDSSLPGIRQGPPKLPCFPATCALLPSQDRPPPELRVPLCAPEPPDPAQSSSLRPEQLPGVGFASSTSDLPTPRRSDPATAPQLSVHTPLTRHPASPSSGPSPAPHLGGPQFPPHLLSPTCWRALQAAPFQPFLPTSVPLRPKARPRMNGREGAHPLAPSPALRRPPCPSDREGR